MYKVSIVIPCYNHGMYLEETIASVLAQTFTDYEIIVINDGSDDDVTLELLQHATWPRTRIIHTANSGVAAARNRGISESESEYILPLDADDKVAPTYLQKAVAVLESSPNVGIVYCQAEFFGEKTGLWDLPEFSLPGLLIGNVIFSAALFRKKDWGLVGGYCLGMHYGWEDWDFWLRLLQLRREVVRLPELLFSYRILCSSRDRSLRFSIKCRLMARLVINNWRLYLDFCYPIFKILLTGKRKRLPMIKVDCG